MTPADSLLEASWTTRARTIRGRELRIELGVIVLFALASGGLILAAGGVAAPHPITAAVVVAYAIAARARFPVGSVTFVPTQLFVVSLFVLAPAALVPLLVLFGRALAAIFAAATGRERLDRIVFCAGDATYSLGPALVLVALAGGEGAAAGPAVIALAFAAQLLADLGASSLHELVTMRSAPKAHLKTVANVSAVDVALTAIGLLAAAAAVDAPAAALAPLPLVLVLTAIAADRIRKIEAAHARLVALEHERSRLNAAVRRVGDALAANLDVDAVLGLVRGAAAEALDGRSTGAGAGARMQAEARLRAGADPLAAHEHDGWHAVAARVGSHEHPFGVVAVSREHPFTVDERELLGQLCAQAAVSGSNARRHERLGEAEARMRHRAYHDELTGLANRALFAERIEDCLRRDRATGDHSAVLFLDLDDFKFINDTLGHDAGDELLVLVAARLRECLRGDDIAARFGGDEFAILVQGLSGAGAAEATAARVRAHIRRPIVLHDREFVVHGSIGVVRVAEGLTHDDVLRRADLAMYAAKHEGGDRVTAFQLAMLHAAETRVELAHDLRGAAARGEFELRFQPVGDLREERIIGAEALVRWRHPRRGELEPDEFIGLAEETGTIQELGRFVLDGACAVAATWPSQVVSVNLSAVQLRDASLAGEVLATLERHGVPASRLMLEMTESDIVGSDPVTLGNLEALRAGGVTLALDDFGTGYSSLSCLAQLPIDVVKLDRSFLAQIDTSPEHGRLAAGLVELGHALQLRLVAEGIERPSQLTYVRELGVQTGQGYLLGAPMEAGAFAACIGLQTETAEAAPGLRLVS